LHDAFRKLVDSQYEALWSYARFLVGSEDQVEDLVHEAFLLAFDRLAESKPFTGDPGKWLRGALRNLLKAWWRKRARLPQDVANQLAHIAQAADDLGEQLDRQSTATALQRCLEKLSADDRDLIALRYEHNHPIVRISERLQINESTARVRLFRVRQALKECVESRFSGEVPR
jgi:RNA polymerase sigma-70 factor (ECF subfamily)